MWVGSWGRYRGSHKENSTLPSFLSRLCINCTTVSRFVDPLSFNFLRNDVIYSESRYLYNRTLLCQIDQFFMISYQENNSSPYIEINISCILVVLQEWISQSNIRLKAKPDMMKSPFLAKHINDIIFIEDLSMWSQWGQESWKETCFFIVEAGCTMILFY